MIRQRTTFLFFSLFVLWRELPLAQAPLVPTGLGNLVFAQSPALVLRLEKVADFCR